MRLAVIGGGISGLAAAWELRYAVETTIFEPGALGGKIQTTTFGGRPVDEGPDAFLTRTPGALELCRELGLEDKLVAPQVQRAMLWWKGKLRPLPDGLVLGAPSSVTPLVRSGLLSPLGVCRAALDLVLPKREYPSEVTVRELVADRFGSQVADRLVDPLVGGIHAGSTRDLGANEVTPQLVDAANRSRSLLIGLRKGFQQVNGVASPFLAPEGGMGVLAAALISRLEDAGASIVKEAVSAVRRVDRCRIGLEPDLGTFDRVVIATPPHTTAAICGEDAAALRQIPLSSVVLATFSLKNWRPPPGYSGFLVPRSEGRLMTAASYYSAKWPLSAVRGESVIRLSAGRSGDTRAVEADDDDLKQRLLGEFAAAAGATDFTTVESRVFRWPQSFPQFLPGHAARVEEVQRRVAGTFPGVALTGSWLRGSGIATCITSARQAARSLIER